MPKYNFSWAKYYFSCGQAKAASKIVRRTKNDLADYFLERTGLQVGSSRE